tara:strand:- start:2038 stop:2883 length:846 start_codon:yes stop_codon:yes gene_type:complete
MATNYFVPRIYLLPPGYHMHLEPPYPAFGKALTNGSAELTCITRVVHEGEVIKETSVPLSYEGGKLVSETPKPIIWHDHGVAWGEHPGFLELDIQTENGDTSIQDYIGPVAYATYYAPGRKAVFADAPLKYASPPTIAQIAEYGRFVEGQAIARIHRSRDYGESIALINPYRRPILATLAGHDGHKLPRLKVPPYACRVLRISDMLSPEEAEWVGHIQLTANNRVVLYDIKHSLVDPTLFSHFEHLDPFRADPTHLPAFKWLRITIGKFLAKRGIYLRPSY